MQLSDQERQMATLQGEQNMAVRQQAGERTSALRALEHGVAGRPWTRRLLFPLQHELL